MSFIASNQTSSGPQIEQPMLGFLIFIYTILILFGTIGNAFIMYMFVINIKLRNVRNAFMANLTISNLLLITICTPSFMVQFIYRQWIFSSFWCKILNSLQIMIILVSAFSIMAISIDRWMVIVYTHSRHLNANESIFFIIFIWLAALLLALPTYLTREAKSLVENIKNFQETQFQNFNINFIKNISSTYGVNTTELKMPSDITLDISEYFKISNAFQVRYCIETWSMVLLKRTYILVLFFLEFVLPCICMLVTYIWIILFLRQQHTRLSHYELLRKRLIQKDKPHKKSCKLLSVLCLIFIICCLPLSIFNIYTEFHIDAMLNIGDDELYSILTILTTFVTINAIINPLLYGWMNHNFRNEIIKYFKSRKEGAKKNSFKNSEIKTKKSLNRFINCAIEMT